jgi:hypothetical protein
MCPPAAVSPRRDDVRADLVQRHPDAKPDLLDFEMDWRERVD